MSKMRTALGQFRTVARWQTNILYFTTANCWIKINLEKNCCENLPGSIICSLPSLVAGGSVNWAQHIPCWTRATTALLWMGSKRTSQCKFNSTKRSSSPFNYCHFGTNDSNHVYFDRSKWISHATLAAQSYPIVLQNERIVSICCARTACRDRKDNIIQRCPEHNHILPILTATINAHVVNWSLTRSQ